MQSPSTPTMYKPPDFPGWIGPRVSRVFVNPDICLSSPTTDTSSTRSRTVSIPRKPVPQLDAIELLDSPTPSSSKSPLVKKAAPQSAREDLAPHSIWLEGRSHKLHHAVSLPSLPKPAEPVLRNRHSFKFLSSNASLSSLKKIFTRFVPSKSNNKTSSGILTSSISDPFPLSPTSSAAEEEEERDRFPDYLIYPSFPPAQASASSGLSTFSTHREAAVYEDDETASSHRSIQTTSTSSSFDRLSVDPRGSIMATIQSPLLEDHQPSSDSRTREARWIASSSHHRYEGAEEDSSCQDRYSQFSIAAPTVNTDASCISWPSGEYNLEDGPTPTRKAFKIGIPMAM